MSINIQLTEKKSKYFVQSNKACSLTEKLPSETPTPNLQTSLKTLPLTLTHFVRRPHSLEELCYKWPWPGLSADIIQMRERLQLEKTDLVYGHSLRGTALKKENRSALCLCPCFSQENEQWMLVRGNWLAKIQLIPFIFHVFGVQFKCNFLPFLKGSRSMFTRTCFKTLRKSISQLYLRPVRANWYEKLTSFQK